MDTFNRNFYQSDVGKFSHQLQNAISKKSPHALTTNFVSTSRQRNGNNEKITCQKRKTTIKFEHNEYGRTNWTRQMDEFLFSTWIKVRMRNLFPSQQLWTKWNRIFIWFWASETMAASNLLDFFSSTHTRDDLCECLNAILLQACRKERIEKMRTYEWKPAAVKLVGVRV